MKKDTEEEISSSKKAWEAPEIIYLQSSETETKTFGTPTEFAPSIGPS